MLRRNCRKLLIPTIAHWVPDFANQWHFQSLSAQPEYCQFGRNCLEAGPWYGRCRAIPGLEPCPPSGHTPPRARTTAASGVLHPLRSSGGGLGPTPPSGPQPSRSGPGDGSKAGPVTRSKRWQLRQLRSRPDSHARHSRCRREAGERFPYPGSRPRPESGEKGLGGARLSVDEEAASHLHKDRVTSVQETDRNSVCFVARLPVADHILCVSHEPLRPPRLRVLTHQGVENREVVSPGGVPGNGSERHEHQYEDERALGYAAALLV